MNTKRLLIGCMAILGVLLGTYGIMAERSKDLEYTGMDKPQEISETVASSTASAWTSQTKLGDIVAQRPQTARIFDLVGID